MLETSRPKRKLIKILNLFDVGLVTTLLIMISEWKLPSISTLNFCRSESRSRRQYAVSRLIINVIKWFVFVIDCV